MQPHLVQWKHSLYKYTIQQKKNNLHLGKREEESERERAVSEWHWSSVPHPCRRNLAEPVILFLKFCLPPWPQTLTYRAE